MKFYFFGIDTQRLKLPREEKTGKKTTRGSVDMQGLLLGFFGFLGFPFVVVVVCFLFCVCEINTSKCFLVFHLFIPAINILLLKKGSNVCS